MEQTEKQVRKGDRDHVTQTVSVIRSLEFKISSNWKQEDNMVKFVGKDDHDCGMQKWCWMQDGHARKFLTLQPVYNLAYDECPKN